MMKRILSVALAITILGACTSGCVVRTPDAKVQELYNAIQKLQVSVDGYEAALASAAEAEAIIPLEDVVAEAPIHTASPTDAEAEEIAALPDEDIDDGLNAEAVEDSMEVDDVAEQIIREDEPTQHATSSAQYTTPSAPAPAYDSEPYVPEPVYDPEPYTPDPATEESVDATPEPESEPEAVEPDPTPTSEDEASIPDLVIPYFFEIIPEPTPHEHNWVEIAVVTAEEQGHWEYGQTGTQTVVDEEAWDELLPTVYACNVCGWTTQDVDMLPNHLQLDPGCGRGYHTLGDQYIHHEAVTHEEPVYGDVWVVDVPEQITTEAYCSICGAHRSEVNA